MRLPFHRGWLLALGLVLAGCDRDPEPSAPIPEPPATSDNATLGPPDPELEQATSAAWALGETWLGEANTLCNVFHERLKTFLAQPTEEGLASTQSHWHQCHNRWHRMTPLLALSDSNPGLFNDLGHIRFLVDAHPLQPGYLDSLEQYPYSGIVNDITLPLNAATLREQHGLTDDADVVLGLHALEFLLWGKNGSRTASDFRYQTESRDQQREATLTEAQLPNNRRRELIRLISVLLQDDLAALAQRWASVQQRPSATYHQLHPSSRLPLLREALLTLLEESLPRDLAHLDTHEQAHNRFAGHGLQPALATLAGTHQLLSAGDPPVSHWLTSDVGRESWEQAWETINLASTSDADAPQRLVPALQSLADALRAGTEPPKADAR